MLSSCCSNADTLLLCCRYAVRMLIYCCYAVVTLFVCCYTVIKLLLPCPYTMYKHASYIIVEAIVLRRRLWTVRTTVPLEETVYLFCVRVREVNREKWQGKMIVYC